MRRFVTYLYEYERGNRGKNCGFIRVDVREGQVQMEVHMRNCSHSVEKGTMYLLVKENEQIFGIEIGDIAVVNGRGERTFEFAENNIAESRHTFEQIIGIGMRCEKDGYLASNWKDEEYEELTWGSFSLFGCPTTIVNESECSVDETEELEKEMEPLQKKTELFETENEDFVISSSISCENLVNESQEEQNEIPIFSQTTLLQTEFCSEDTSASSCNTDCFKQVSSEDTSIKRCSYQKITVSDIRNLPSPNWYLCNNNFLLHGFFNYEYLIIKKERIHDKEKFYLGVPGVFEKQEKAMAMMFGFPYFENCSPQELENPQEFEQVEKEEPKEGDFGCWYLLLTI